MTNKWLRIRFRSNSEDCRPIYTPPDLPEGPWWRSGFDGEDNAILIAYVKSEETIYSQWPEAEDLDVEQVDEIVFTSRFPKPDWWSVSDDK